jgi:hypothetical protein
MPTATSSVPAIPPLGEVAPRPADTRPWLFVPVLYAMQAIPISLVGEVSTLTLKDLGVNNLQIATWTSLVTLPWTLKLFWAPLVDVNFTKRTWLRAMQVLVTLALLALAWAVNSGEHFFAITIGILFCIAMLSATHDIAGDGMFLLAVPRRRKPLFSGVQVTVYRLGRLFCIGGLVWLAGMLSNRGGLSVRHAWMVAIGVGAAVYAAGAIWNRFALPDPPDPQPRTPLRSRANLVNLAGTGVIVAVGAALYFWIKAALMLSGAAIAGRWGIFPGAWAMQGDAMRVQLWVLLVATLLLVPLTLLARAILRGTPVGSAFTS